MNLLATNEIEEIVTANNMAILDNLMLEQENARVARGIGSQTNDLVENDCVIMLSQPTRRPQSNVPTKYASLLVNFTLPISASAEDLEGNSGVPTTCSVSEHLQYTL